MNREDKYKYSVIDVMRTLVEGFSGSSELPGDYEELISWLEWRIKECWDASESQDEHKLKYECALLDAACAAVTYAKRSSRELKFAHDECHDARW